MSSSNIAEMREDTREVFERIMELVREDFEVRITEAVASNEDQELWIGLDSDKKMRVVTQSIMYSLACSHKIDPVQWAEGVLERQNPGHRFKLTLSKMMEIGL